MINDKLIFDLGFYTGDTSLHYLKEGYKVVGVDCNPNLEIKNDEINNFIENGQLILERKCITNEDNKIVNFYIQPKKMVWSSTNIEIAERHDKSICCQVETITLASLIRKYGTPIFCKIDIEGNDILAIKSLLQIEEKPLYISCETECIGNNVNPFSIDGLENINALRKLGYTKFFLVKQTHWENYHFNINGNHEWKTYEEILDELIKERFKHNFEHSYTFWWDVYATF